MPIKFDSKTITSGTTADFPCPTERACPTQIIVPASAASTTASLHAQRPDGSYGLVYDVETNAALVSGVTIAADRMYVIRPTVAAQFRGLNLRLVLGSTETAKSFVVGWSEYE